MSDVESIWKRTTGVPFEKCACDVCYDLRSIETEGQIPSTAELKKTAAWTGLAEQLAVSLGNARHAERDLKVKLEKALAVVNSFVAEMVILKVFAPDEHVVLTDAGRIGLTRAVEAARALVEVAE